MLVGRYLTRNGRMPATVGVILSTLLTFVFGLVSTSLADGPTGKGASSDETLADEVNDPLARLTQIQIKNEYTPSEYGTDAQPNTLQIRTIFTISTASLDALRTAHSNDGSDRYGSAGARFADGHSVGRYAAVRPVRDAGS
jgi:hypothetical protein